MKRLLLLGGGHAHLQVLRGFAAAPPAAAEVTLVSPAPVQTYSGMVPGVVAGHYAAAAAEIALRPLAQAARARFVQGAAVALDAATRHVLLADGRPLPYDVLSIDTGGVQPREQLPGAREHALFVRPIDHFVRLWASVPELAARSSLGVVLVGGGAAGVELALAAAHVLGERARVSLVTGGGPPLAAHPAAVQKRARHALQRLRITVLEEACTAITARHVELESGLRLACDAPVLATGIAAPPWLRGSGLMLSDDGFVATGPCLQSLSHPEVFAVGDVASRADAPRPKSGVYAVRAGPPLAHNLRAFVAGGALQAYRPQRLALNLLACGAQHAIASWGPLAFEGAWVWRWKDRIDRAFVEGFRMPPA